MLTVIEQIQELIKSYYIASLYDTKKALEILANLNQLRLELVIDAEMRRIFYNQINVTAQTGKNDIFFSRNDIDYTIKRGIAYLLITTTVNLEKRSGAEKVFTRETTAWQQLFSAVQGNDLGLEILQDLPQELRFGDNEALNIGFQGQTENGWLFLHGSTLQERLDVSLDEINAEIKGNIPQTQLVPLPFLFEGVADTPATDVGGNEDIFSIRNDRSVLLTHVSTTATDCRISLYDEGKNLQICDLVEAAGVASNYLNKFTTWYELPYPHLLRRGDRLKLRAINGSDITAEYVPVDTNQYLTFKGFTI